MRLLKWLFQPAYLLLIIVIVALYVNREVVFPEEVAESLEAEALVARIEDMSDGLREDIEEALEPTEAAEASPVEATVEEPVAVEEPETASVDTVPVEVVEDESAAEAAPTEVAEQPAAEVVVQAEPSEAETSQPERENIVESAPGAVQEAPEAPVEAAPVASPLALWQQARAAVWQGDLDQAVSHYQELVAIQPDNYDAYGEMGNVLLAQSKAGQAAEAYATAARLIYRSGNREIAYRVADIVLQLDQTQAEGLRQEFAR